MRSTVHDQAANTFFEGPMDSETASSKLTENNAEKADYHADLTQEYEVLGEDIDIPAYEVDERHD